MAWIKYSEKRPVNSEKCWVCCCKNFVSVGVYENYHHIFGSGFGSYDEDDEFHFQFHPGKYVKYWMPYFTPSPPQE